MKTEYRKEYSHILGRDMEYKIYGHAGKPVLFIPCMGGRFFDFEDFHMDATWAPWIESGRVQVFSIDTIDNETWNNPGGDPRQRIELHERWLHAVVDELMPYMRAHNTYCNGGNFGGKWMSFGCSLGAMHAGIFYFRYPDLFDKVLGLSGTYLAAECFHGYSDELTYANSPVDFISNMPADHDYISKYNEGQMIFCVGQGAWEEALLFGTHRLEDACRAKGINGWFDYWGHDVNHDWPWWYKQCDYFLPKMLG
ncbi:MAG: esterase family protein [Lachnospiraceae bacterium]|nr:esterase family protein [Lachnospiraceae bacterium]